MELDPEGESLYDEMGLCKGAGRELYVRRR